MPRAVSVAMKAALADPATRLTTIVIVTLPSAEVLRFTTWSESFTFEGNEYSPVDGIAMSKLDSADGSSVDNGRVTGQYVDDRIHHQLLQIGGVQGAKVEVKIVCLDDLTAGSVTWGVYTIGETQYSEQSWSAETRGLTSKLKIVTGDLTSKLCRCQKLGDAECKVNMAGNKKGSTGTLYPIRSSRTVYSVTSSMEIVFAASAEPSGFFSVGTATFTTGPNAGIVREVREHTLASGRAVCKLVEPFPFAVTAGDVATLEAGCDRRFTTCDDAFENANNFHGEPNIPGNDALAKRGKRS